MTSEMLLTVVAFVVIQVTNGAKPPEHYCAISKDHTMCQYRRFNSMGLRCRHYHSMPTNGVRRMMLREHNSLRDKYASHSKQQFTVPNMLGLEWDEELAEIAEQWAMQCPYYEDDFRDVVRFKVANLVGIASHESSYSNLLEVWNSLVEGNMTFHKMPDGPKKKFHKLESAFKLDQPLTLITNPYFKYFGCAAAIYRQFIVEDEMFRTTLVCNYGPLLANYDKVQPAGLPCTRCPNETYCHKTSSYPNLCFENMSSTLSNGEQIPVREVELRDEMYEYSEDYEEAETTTSPHKRTNDSKVTTNGGGRNNTSNYCNIICDNGALHTLCTYENVQSKDYDDIVPILGKPSKSFIVTIHNGIRDDVAGAKGGENIIKDLPLAANMRELVWNEELAQIAARWTMQCKGEKDECRDIYLNDDQAPTYVSQLINVSNWTGTGLFPSVTDAFYQWMVGMPFFTKDVIQTYVDPPGKKSDYSAFAQIIWAESYMIGCGMTICRKLNQTMSRVVTACNYAPGGMVVGKSVFKVGGPCSQCDKLGWKGIRGGFCSDEYLSLCSVRMVGESIISLSLLNPVHSLASFPNVRPSEPINPPTDGANGISWVRLFASTSPIPCDYKCFYEDRTHTMCKYRSSLPGPNCVNLLYHNGGLAEEMVDLHNEVRDYVASGWDTDTAPAKLRINFPQASDMREMVWNEQLAATAQRWAIQCTLYTDSCRDLKLSSDKKYILNKNEIPEQDHMRAKQLVAWKEWDVTYDPPSARQFFNDWLDEVANFSIEDIPAYVKRKRFTDKSFVQIIWSRSYMIGCAMVSFDSRPGFRTIYLVCNYAPGGGQHRWPVYHIGGPCTKCEPLYAEGTDGMICSKKRLSLCQTDFSLSVKMGTDKRLLFLLLMTSQIIKSLLSNYYYHFDPHAERTHV